MSSGVDPGFPVGGRGPVLRGAAWTFDASAFWSCGGGGRALENFACRSANGHICYD